MAANDKMSNKIWIQNTMILTMTGAPLFTGDILIEINGLPITSQQDLTAFLSSDSLEDPCWVTVHRDGAQLTFEEIR